MDFLTLVAIGLLVVGVVGSLLPAVPGAPFSLAGVYVYWWHTGFKDPGTLWLVGFTLLGLTALAADWFAGAAASKAGGASWLTTAVAAVVGLALLFVAGPLGVVVGVAGTVFLLEARKKGASAGARAAAYATVGMLGSVLVQALLTGSMLVAFLWVVWG